MSANQLICLKGLGFKLQAWLILYSRQGTVQVGHFGPFGAHQERQKCQDRRLHGVDVGVWLSSFRVQSLRHQASGYMTLCLCNKGLESGCHCVVSGQVSDKALTLSLWDGF